MRRAARPLDCRQRSTDTAVRGVETLHLSLQMSSGTLRVYEGAQIEFQMMCESSQAWAGAFLRNPGEGIGDERKNLRFLSWGNAELFNIHPANRFFIGCLSTISPRDWWWVGVRVQERDAAAWISREGQEWLCVDWGGLMDAVPESGRILLSVREGPPGCPIAM